MEGRLIGAVLTQPADDPPIPFSTLTDCITLPQISCSITRTTAKTHQIIAESIHLSAVYNGQISGIGPRYCPSIEDKVHRFADKSSHQIFLEPEGLDNPTIYPNGISIFVAAPYTRRDDCHHSGAGNGENPSIWICD